MLRSLSVSPRTVRHGEFFRGTPAGSQNPWERGIPVSHRSDGSVMPYLDREGGIVPQKAWGESWRRQFQDAGLA